MSTDTDNSGLQSGPAMSRSLRIALLSIAILLTLNLLIGTGLIAGWGTWYSASLPYRRQTDSLLSGKIALSSSPTTIELDMVWAEGGVQQVWGLGVPFWRLPFEALARFTGQAAFPDRIAFAAAVFAASWLVLRMLTVPPQVLHFHDWLEQIRIAPTQLAAAILLLLFPPIITLCSGPFNVYEEAVAYGYYYAIALFAATIAFVRRPKLQLYLVLSMFAGVAAFVRPTIGAYGFSTVVIAWFVTRRAGWSWRHSLAGPALFAIGCAMLFWSNWKRFGSGLEFGHQLTLSAWDLMYCLRFPAPFAQEPLWSAAKELFGSLFFVNKLNGFAVYRSEVVAWQSSTPRWRHFYQTTFDGSYIVGIVACWALAAWSALRSRQERSQTAAAEFIVSAVWSFVSICSLAVFYIRYTAMSSRYVLDFAPAIGATLVGCLLAIETTPRPLILSSKFVRNCLLAAISGWWVYEIVVAKQFFPQTETYDQGQVVGQMQHGFPKPGIIPAFYNADTNPSDVSGIPQDGRGWTHPSGQAEALVVLFVNDPQQLRLEVAPTEGKTPSDEQYEAIRAKVGLETLSLESIERTQRGRVLTFSAPKRAAYRQGIQVVFLAFVGSDEFLQRTSPFRLLRVDWRSQENAPSDSK